MEITGKLKVINAEEQVSSSFKKRVIVVTTDEQFPQYIMIEFNQDKCDLLNNYRVGQNVKVSINLRGREWFNPDGEAKYFNSIQGWRIESLEQKNEGATRTYSKDNPPKKQIDIEPKEEDSDLPF